MCNAKVFRNEEVNTQVVCARALALYNSNIGDNVTDQVHMKEWVWHNSARRCFKINVDAAYKSNEASTGIILWDDDGASVFMAAYISTKNSALKAKLWAISLGLEVITKLGYHNVTIENGCLKVVTLLSEVSSIPPWCAFSEVLCCRRLLELHPTTTATFVRKQAKQVAHLTASESSKENKEYELFSNGSNANSCILDQLNVDRMM